MYSRFSVLKVKQVQKMKVRKIFRFQTREQSSAQTAPVTIREFASQFPPETPILGFKLVGSSGLYRLTIAYLLNGEEIRETVMVKGGEV
jgi:hypothetical protein